MTSKRPVTAEDLYRYTWIVDPAICPSASKAAYVCRTIDEAQNDYRSHIRVVSLKDGLDVPFTHGEKDVTPAWSPDGSLLAFLRVNDKGRQLWAIPAAGGEAAQLTNAKRGIASFAWSPNGQYIAFTTRVNPDEGTDALSMEEDRKSKHAKPMLITRTCPKEEGSGLSDGLNAHLFVLELASGKVNRLTEGFFDINQPFWSPDSRKIGFIAKITRDGSVDADLQTFADVFTVGLSGGPLVRITDSTLAISQASFSPDGKSIAFIGNDRQFGSATQNNLYRVSAEGGDPVRINGETDIQIGNFALSDMKAAAPPRSPWYSPDGRSLYVLGSFRGDVHVYRFTTDGEAEAVTRGERDVFQFVVSADGTKLLTASSNPLLPCDLYLIDLQTREEQRITRSNDELLEQLSLCIPESIRFETSDGGQVHGWIMKPEGSAHGNKVPLILQIHGGPHAMYANTYSHDFQMMASSGYMVLYTNPRGSFGYGQPFAQACRGDFGGGDYRDVMEAVDYVTKIRDDVDESRLGVTGGSYGGFLTNWIVGHSDRFRAAVTERSISNWLSFYGMSDIGISYTEGVIQGNPWDDPEKLWAHSPLAYVKNIQTPLLILHGEQDLRCPIEQADQLYVALRRLGKRTQLVRFPDSNHTFLKNGKPSLRLARLERIAGWFHDHLYEGDAGK
ncbi:S9 family peptidase [Paenibacillus hamazuiensis]|uniref:S9 family peptidase n=1 Tax=Paenibacillus hamazuiensis TaxID=2936508 RepID=UPI00200E8384|nr:S9 family peptidase [Paenibacillus hamazuiensis]